MRLRLRRSRKRVACTNLADRPSRCLTELPDVDEGTRQIIEQVQPFTMTSPARITALCDAVRYLENHRIEGAVVECGVWQGGSMMAVAATLLNCQNPHRDLWLYDTFEGMTEPTASDVDYLGRAAASLLAQQSPEDPDSIWCHAQLDFVKRNLQSTAYPMTQVHFLKGPVEQTIPAYCPNRIALLRLDTDWYESTRHELVHLMPRLVPGGVLIIDDYGHWQGCRRAVDEYFRQNQISMLLNRIDYTGRIGVLNRPVFAGGNPAA